MLARPVWGILHTDLDKVHGCWVVVQTEPAHMWTRFTEALVVPATGVSLFSIVPKNIAFSSEI